MESEKGWGGMAGLMGAIGVLGGALTAYGLPTSEKEKTPEELKSERNKWEKQAGMAQVAVLDVSFCLSEKTRACAALEEQIRLAGLEEEKLSRKALEAEKRAREAEKERDEAKADAEDLKRENGMWKEENERFRKEIARLGDLLNGTTVQTTG
jgi:FtsZ-binding cell division protein ZapB